MDRTIVRLALRIRTIALKETNHPGSVGHLLVADRRLIVLVAPSRQASKHGFMICLSWRGRAPPGTLLSWFYGRGLFLCCLPGTGGIASFQNFLFNFCHSYTPSFQGRQCLSNVPIYRGNITGLRFVEIPVASCRSKCDCSAIAISDLPPCALSSGPKVMTRSCVRSRLALRKFPVALIVARVSTHVGVRSPL